MAKLIFSLGGSVLGEYPLDKERMTIGRRPSNDIHLDNLAVSGEHAAVITIGIDSFLEDLDSTNGTLVNGKPIKKHVLQHADVIEVGKYQLRYVNEKAVAGAGRVDAVPGAQVTVQPPLPAAGPRPSSAGAAAVADSARVKPAAPEGMTGHLRVLNGPDTGKALMLSKALTTLGKQGVQVAVITKRPHGYFITHVEGTAYPVVNGASAGPQAHALTDHDVIEMAGVKMEFYLAAGSPD